MSMTLDRWNSLMTNCNYDQNLDKVANQVENLNEIENKTHIKL